MMAISAFGYNGCSIPSGIMHNVSAATLYDSVKHYEKGGIDRPSRSPLMMPLQLTEQERLDLVSFMESLTGAPEPARTPR